MHTFHTRRLGDSIHAYAVMSAMTGQGGDNRFHAYAPFAELFSGGLLKIRGSSRGSTWTATSKPAFVGPEHGRHVRDSMAKAAGIDEVSVAIMLNLPTPTAPNPVPVTSPYIVICPDTGARYKEWPRQLWAPLIEYVLSRNFQVIVCGAPGRRPIPTPAQARHSHLSALPFAHVLAGAQAVVGPDSGHIHLADALGVPAVGLYAATSTTTYGPYRDSRWCIDRHLSAFSPDNVYNSARHVISDVMSLVTLDDVVGVLARLFEAQQGESRPSSSSSQARFPCPHHGN
jgi:hypothetical protein